MISTPDPAALTIQAVHKRYDQKKVLDGIDLSVPTGSVLGLLGKNGAGKTTLIKCALGLVRPDSGTIRVLGDLAQELTAATKARIGYVPQEISLYPWMRVRQLLDYMAAFYPKWNSALVQQMLKDWEVSTGDKVGKMSVGTRQKLAIILALAHEPDLLVLDEPAASLDPAARREFLKAVLEIAAGGQRTVVFSTHITSDLERVADRVAILRGGVIAYEGELDELKDSVKRLHVTSANPLPLTLDVPGAVRIRVEGNEALVSVRNVSEQILAELRAQHAASVRVEDLNLEDIFVEVQHARP
ncbi:MAG TPA: ABC transporter ATP-binding protein [Tepidisphaeraceae bacterium]|jgi:ABC-2 type transport system ATP-binding protein|nr:ABC transporter ATP-binding protein [Tepidisphaeraceae bacterium]